MTEATRLLTMQFLEWVGAKPRTCAETMEAWRTSCPRMPVWEDAVDEGLVCAERFGGACQVKLTPEGRAVVGAERRGA